MLECRECLYDECTFNDRGLCMLSLDDCPLHDEEEIEE